MTTRKTKTTKKRRQQPRTAFCDECLIKPAIKRTPQGNLCHECLNAGSTIINAGDGEEVDLHA